MAFSGAALVCSKKKNCIPFHLMYSFGTQLYLRECAFMYKDIFSHNCPKSTQQRHSSLMFNFKTLDEVII